jgi:N-acetylglucosaminyldiphosphoundecaprenol N-acetyl-beta-D-mannosaminyltransferase
MNNPIAPSVNGKPPISVLGTPLQTTTYDELTAKCKSLARCGRPVVVDFTNTQIVTLRRHDPRFRVFESRVDYYIPDGMPLIWCLNWNGARLSDRVYGPTFMRHCVLASSAPITHYFVGGGDEKIQRLQQALLRQNPNLKFVGQANGYDSPAEAIVDEINRASPDFIWVGLGTPKQHVWIYENKIRIKQGVIFGVGFAFDVIAGTKNDAPLWMQKRGLTWAFRLASEPRRLAGRYFKYNSLFLFYLFWDGLRGRAFRP